VEHSGQWLRVLEETKAKLLSGEINAKDPTFQQTALMVAVRENHPDVVTLLVERGADVNARTRTGATPAWVLPNSVPGFGHGIGIVRGGLPDRGLRNPIPGGMSPLLYAAREGCIDCAKLFALPHTRSAPDKPRHLSCQLASPEGKP